ncbi:MAG: UDP-glucose--hexose-1-phosphate uridylyltransferase [Ruminococcaceae bacterium]|nr:UDP-glucose--hexose-1-phosphate uridylyltransferase [Oscillospiraceae bacterium]
MSVYAVINGLINYGLERGLISPLDIVYTRNKLCDILGLSEFSEEEAKEASLCELLTSLCDYAEENGIIEKSQTARDLFDTRLMGELTPKPSEVISEFCELYLESPEASTDWYYNFSKNTDYIRTYRIEKDKKWQVETEYGTLDITINLSKPEKDPKEIERAKTMKKSAYPKCALCVESEGYAGRFDFPARQNHRVIPIEISGESWCFQYSPYVYYNEHCIAFNREHTPMVIDEKIFSKLTSFLDVFPHYFVGSNADLPIVGGSILAHEHFQGGRYTFAMEKAPVEKEYKIPGFEDINVGRVKWPMSVIRISGEDKEKLSLLASKILVKWRGYTDEDAYVFAQTDGVPHNTVTPIARKRDGLYEIDIVLRNNITTEERPSGLYHPRQELHHIKRENIGLIEVMGLAVLPARLSKSLELMCECAENGGKFEEVKELEVHLEWINKIFPSKKQDESYEEFFKKEIGKVFAECLKCAGVFARDEKGNAAFDKFMDEVKK